MPDNHLPTEPATDRATPAGGGNEPLPDRTGRQALSFAQQRLWFLSRIAGVSEAYHMPLAIALTGQLDRAALSRALDALVARHEALRTRFGTFADEAFCLLDRPDRGFALRFDDLVGEPDPGARLAVAADDEANAPFDLEAGPLARGRLVRLAAGRHVLLVTMHHIISDGWSMGVFTRELGALYTAFDAGDADPLPPLPIRYADYAAWQRRWLAGGVAGQQGAYWKQALAGAPALLDLPTDRPRPAEQDYHGDSVRVEIDAELTARLKALGQRHGATLFMTLLAAWALVLSRLSGQDDVVVGTPTAGRRRAELNGLIGFFVNTLAVRVDVSAAPTVVQLLGRVREVVLAALDHQDMPFEQVVELLNPARSLAYTPLFQAMFAWQNNEEGDLALPGVTVTPIRSSYQPAKFDLNLTLVEDRDRIVGHFGYATALFDSGTARRHVHYLHRVLTQMVADPDRPVGAIALVDEAERHRLLAASDGGPSDGGPSDGGPSDGGPSDGGTVACPRRRLLHQLFEVQAARDPDAVAVTDDGPALSYGELNARANRLAHHLAARGVGPDRLVAICVERSSAMVVGMLAVLKAGGAYVPLDPAYPAERLTAMLGDSAPAVVLTHAPARGALSAALAAVTAPPPVIDLDADAPAWAGEPQTNPVVDDLAPDHLAYVIYTSGTTGAANGVLVEHRHLAAVAAAWERSLGLRPGLTHLQMASLSFDVCTADVVRALGFGGRLVLCPRGLLADEAGLYALIRRRGVDFADFVPTVLVPLMAHVESVGGTLAGFETLICGSEAWTPGNARRLRALAGPGVRILNAYGVTEAAVDSTHYLLPADGPDSSAHLPIGRPLPGVRLYLLDDAGEPVPDGVTGEIHVGGAGVARGYLNRPELTARRFMASPFVAGDRLYRTGDLGRRRPDGDVEFLGRRDFQVKIRGLRVELGEIEAALAGGPGVCEAVVTAGAGDRLVAYYLTGAGPVPDAGELRDRLAAVLPWHMVPAAYVRLDAWPLTPNGKLDRAALPAPDADAADARGYAEPAGPMEAALAPLWAEVLGVERVGRHDDFFVLGGHSLSAMRLVAKVRRALGREVSPATLFAAPTLIGFARRLETADREVVPPIGPADRSGPLPASFAQQRLWFLAQLEGASDAYHMPQAWELTGALNAAMLARAWDALAARHEALRTRFVAVEGAARQLLDPAGPALRFDDLSGEPDPGARLAELRRDEATAPFDLAAGPLARAHLVRLAAGRHVLLVTLHHIVSDGWSMGVFTRELGALYTALHAGRPDPLPPLPVQYADYAAWQREWLAGDAVGRQGAFWARTLDGAPAELGLPTDRPRPAEQDYRGGQVRFELDAELTTGLRELSRRHGGTVFMTLLAAWALVLSRLSGQDDVVIGTPTANRRRDELAGLIGFFVNTLALRVEVSGAPTIAQLLRRARDVTLVALDHQDMPFEQVVELLNPARSLARTPLFQTMLTWQDDGDTELTLPDVTAAALGAPYTVAKFDLTLALVARGDSIVGALDYATALFDADTARRYAGYLHRVLAQMVADPGRAAGTLALTDGAERRRLLDWGAAAGRNPHPRSIQELFEARAAAAPDAVAVAFEGRSLTYGELNARANRLAYHLRKLGVGPDGRVAICTRRSPEMIVGLTAIIKAGGAYVPLDPAYPAERLAFMLADSAPVLLLTQADLRDGLPAGPTTPVLCLDSDDAAWAAAQDTDPPVTRHPDHLAYVIYTSGSTGRPKGVAQTWRCADNLVDWMLHDATPDSPPPARVLQFASTSFDVSFQEVWSTLCAGATLVLMAEERRAELGELRRFIAEQGVQRAFLPAAVLQQIAVLGDATTPGPWPGCEIVTAGEALRITDDIRALVAHLGGDRLYNHYGPTETHAATDHPLVVTDAAAWPALPPIGRPVTGARIYLLDSELAPVPVGVVGEVYIGGAGLARGYLGRPAMTADRFVPDPFAGPGVRMYRSGDLARFRPDAAIDYVGRADGQVKVRGFRVEPGEVEAVLQQADGVRGAAVLVHGDTPADRHLVAYVAGDVTVAQVRERARLLLPGHMVPTRWVRLDRLPLTANGKLDRRALPTPDEADGGPPYVAPRTPQEAAMAAIWAQILCRERVGAHDDFFALGGHSLLATRLVHAINQRMSAHLSLRDLFRAPVLADLAAHLARGDGEEAAAYVFPPLAPDPAGRYQPFPLTDIQEAYWVGRGDSIELGGVGAHGYSELRLREFDEERCTRALDRLVARHDMLRAVFDADGTQRVLKTVPPYRMPRHDLRGLDPAGAAARLDAVRDRMSHHVFDVGRWPLFEFAVTRLDGEIRLHVSLDALIVDVASSQILERELARLYADPVAQLPPLEATFRDYVLAERALREAPRYERALHYWRQRVADLAPAPGLPLARAPETVRRPHFVRYDRAVPAEQWSALKAAATARAVTPSVLLLTAFAEVLGRWSREPRFTLSLPLFNRLPLHADINAVIGDFTSLILVEVDVAGAATFAERARAVQGRLWQDIDHAAVSGVRVNRELARARGTAHAAMPIVFNSTLSELAPGAADGGLAAALRAEPVHSITQTPQVWIDHTVLESAGRLYYNWDSLDELFPGGMVAEMFAAYGDLLARLAHPAAWTATAAEAWPAARLAPPAAQPPATSPMMHELFDRRALQAPDAPAVLAPGRRIGYGRLRRDARHLAGRLQDRGVRAGDLVAVLADRGWEQVVATLAVLYAGGAYVPVDPAWPAARIAHVLERTGARIALVQPGQPGSLELPDDVEPAVVDEAACAADGPELRPVTRTATDLAYVIYTSGSTGTPKGVMIDHRGAVNTLLDITERFGVGPDDRVLAISSLSFDLSVFDIFGTLSAGAAVVTLDPELARDPAHWLDLARTHRVSVWNSVPALLGLLVEYAEAGRPLPASLRLAMLSGDWIAVALPDRARRLLPDLQVHSLGGATEASIWSIHYPVGVLDPAWRSIPYGRALRHQSVHVLDGALRPRPNWAVGQLYIGGAGLARGYWRDEVTTAASFVTHPVTSERLYRTGDLGRRRPDGTIEFLGREDGQVKIHGYRVELGEIEAALAGHPAVQAAAVRLLGAAQGDKRLAAYVVPAGDSRDEAALAGHLSATLPGYMVPASYTYLEALPLSANGKVDRAALPEPAAGADPPAPAPALTGPDEVRLVAAVQRILGVEQIAPDANLLRLGATSIDIVRIGNALHTELGFRPRLAQFMRQPTLADLLKAYRTHARERSAAGAAPPAAGPDGGGVVDDPAARAEFKARGEGRRVFGDEATTIALPVPADPAAARRYTDYRSVRRFAQVPVEARDVGALLGCLSPREVAGTAKYLYGSAGGAYPVQTYLYVKPGRVAGVPGGAHYYDPYRHRLVELGRDRVLDPDAYDYFVNRPVFEAGAFALFLVAEMAAIEPLYGAASFGFCQLEAGAMAQLLTMVAVRHGLGLCGIGSVEQAAVAALLDLGPTHRTVYSMVGGARAAGAADPVGAAPGEADAVEMEDVEI